MIFGDNLALKLSQKINLPFTRIKEVIFNDGEIKPFLEKEISPKEGIVLLQKKEKENINTYIIKYYFILEKLKELTKELIAIIPYFPYARQDKIFKEGEPLSSLYTAQLLEKNVSKIITFNFHQHRKEVGDLFKKRVYNLSLFNFIKEKLKENNKISEKILVIGPDEESERFVKDFIKNENYSFFIFNKKRSNKTKKVKFYYQKQELKNLLDSFKEVVIVDDIVSTGGTVKKVKEILLSFNKKLKISLVFIHPVLGNLTIKNLKKNGFSRIYTTNTIENRFYFVDFTDFLKEELKKII